MDENPSIAGVTAVYVYDGHVIAHASDFNRSRPGGFTVLEAQTHRVEQALALAVVRALASTALHENLDGYACEQIVRKMKGKSYIIPVAHAPSVGVGQK
jgi:hypothetical protein